jgi:hypothetical protein
MPGRRCLKTREAANYLGLSLNAMRHMRQLGIGPAYLRLDIGRGAARPVAYLLEDLDDWLLAQRKKPAQVIKSRWLGEED